MDMIDLPNPLEFEWDKGNNEKNWRKHHVHVQECEAVFLDPAAFIFPDLKHSGLETRYAIIGFTKERRLLLIVFTIRNNKLRVISARNADKKERGLYEKTFESS